MALNEQQQAIVEALGGTVNVMAGAGTGKTFTLTQRIVASIEDSISRGEESPISRVMAITFTDLAAAELKSRVRSALFEKAKETEGATSNAFRDAALNVDSSWISTIHAMAGRILRENAIELGIDPEFDISDDEATRALQSLSFEETLALLSRGQDGFVDGLLERESVYSSSPMTSSIYDKVMTLLDDIVTLPCGLKAISLPDMLTNARNLLESLIMVGDIARDHMLEDGWSASDATKGADYAEQIEAAIEASRKVLDRIGDLSFIDEEFPIGDYATAVHSFPPTTNKFGSRKEAHAQALSDYRETYRRVSDEVAAVCGLRRTIGLIAIAAGVEDAVAQHRLQATSSFEHGEILERCLDELVDPKNARILERYRDQFDRIMVDEFQDTDKLQLRIIEVLSRELRPEQCLDAASSSRLGNVCTVGDMQQSIYRFRGGDVEESVKRVEALKDVEGAQFELSCNYRSHGDILKAVEVVFSQPVVFGDEFLALSAARERDDAQSMEIFSSRPRVEFDFVHATRKKAGETEGVSRAEAVAVVAMDIAERFKSLSDAGVPSSKMAVLLGRMTYASVFSEALRAAGLESVIAGGSVFSEMPEALLAESLLRFAENQADEVALVQCLTSPLFAVSDEALLAMATRAEDGIPTRVHLSDSFKAACHGDGDVLGQLDPESAEALQSACRLLMAYATESAESPSRAMRNLMASSGYLLRLQSDGSADALAAAGNIEKALRIIEGLERKSTGSASVASAYSEYLASVKETPGMLSTTDADFVRIMTVHRSKGLEFDHVAVAELRDGVESPSGLVVESIDDVAYVAQSAIGGDFDDPQAWENRKKLLGFDFEQQGLEDFADAGKTERSNAMKELVRSSTTPASRLMALAEYSKMQELEEARRLLYVAMTRARESLIVANAFSSNSKQGTYPGIFDDIIKALEGHYEKPAQELASDISISSDLIAYERKTLVRERLDEERLDLIAELTGSHAGLQDDDAAPPAAFEVPVYPEPKGVHLEPFQYNWRDVESYTSLSSAHAEPASAAFPYEVDSTAEQHDQGAEGNRSQTLLIADVADDGAVDDGVAVEIPEDPTGLGTAFHRIMQLSIEDANLTGEKCIGMPSKDATFAQIKQADLTKRQQDRLFKALSLMFGSSILPELSSFGRIGAEVPFCTDMGGFFLQGEIDALSDDGHGHAMLLDYKTGYLGMNDEEEMRSAHEMQAMCYTYALIEAGFESVEAWFIHVEMPDATDPSSPAIVKYSFGIDSKAELCDAIKAARVYA